MQNVRAVCVWYHPCNLLSVITSGINSDCRASAWSLLVGGRCDGKCRVVVYLFESVILLHLLQRLCIVCFYSVVFDTTAIFYDGKVFSMVNREVCLGIVDCTCTLFCSVLSCSCVVTYSYC